MSLLGVPISYIYIYATQYTVEAFGGSLWPQRLIGFSMGMVSFAILTYLHLNESLQEVRGITVHEAYYKDRVKRRVVPLGFFPRP